MAAPSYGGSGWLWDCGYGGPWLWRHLAMAGCHRGYRYYYYRETEEYTDMVVSSGVTHL